MPVYKYMKPTDFAPIFKEMVTIYENNKAELGIPNDELVDYQTASAALNDSISNYHAKKDAFEAAGAAMRDAHLLAADFADSRNKMIKANKKISNPIKESLNISTKVGNAAVNLTPNEPTDLTVIGFYNGINRLTWKRNGNTQNTPFIIEHRFNETEAWQYLDVITATKYEHIGQTPGVKIYYRIIAKRSKTKSGHSNIAVAYG